MSSRGRSSSPYSHRRPSSPYSSSSTSSFLNTSGRFIPRSTSSSSSSSFLGSAAARSTTPHRTAAYSMHSASRSYGAPPRSSPVAVYSDDLLDDSVDAPRSSADSISVTIRFRPLNQREFQHGDESAWYPDADKMVRSQYNQAMAYAFDKVFGPDATTIEVYEVASRPVIKAAMEGVNGTVFAYGVTSSGKTHTMHGDQSTPGIIPLAIKDVFSIIQDSPGREYLLRVSYLEIYNEVINDLLDPTGQNLRVREDVQGTYVEGIKEEVVLSPGHALSFIASGEEHRHVGSNNFNLLSSRSHTIFTLMIESSARGDEYDGVIFSQLNLIDLAGSESSKTETTGVRRKEGAYINKSLLTLGTVIGKLSEGKASHVPYRDSKLTRLLQTSLSGHGHLICTVTPASSSMEETHNTLKFASRAKRVEIYASRNKIIDEKSLIKKYQREISTLKQELGQLRQGMLVGISNEEIVSLKQQLEAGQVKMQSRLEEEEEAKTALMSRIQRLTKLILVSSKNVIPGILSDSASDRRNQSTEDKSDDGPLLGDVEIDKDSPSPALIDPSGDLKHRGSLNRLSPTRSSVIKSNQSGEIMRPVKLSAGHMISSDELELLVEQVKMLAGEIAFNTSTLKRLVEQSVNDPNAYKIQVEKMEMEIQEKRKQMMVLEKQIAESGKGSVSNASLFDMQQTIMRLTTQCSDKDFELELKTADNRILQEQLQYKSAENQEQQERLEALEQLFLSTRDRSSLSPEQHAYIEELKDKIQSQEKYNQKLKLEHIQLQEENSGLQVQIQKLSEEASYAKELASAAAVELTNLAGEVTKLSLQNAKLEKELQAAQARNGSIQGSTRKYNDGNKQGIRGRLSARTNENFGNVYWDYDAYNLDVDKLKMELQARKQHEAVLEAALVEKDVVEEEYRKITEGAKRREVALENDLANMWVFVAKLKKEVAAVPETKRDGKQRNGELVSEDKANYINMKDGLKEVHTLESTKPVSNTLQEEPMVARLKARMQGIREKELKPMKMDN
ncbi:hypothetical protein V2J09_021197 [Rumex salicifolius]